MFSREEDLSTLCLPRDTQDHSIVKKAFHKLALRCHPDKGGTKEAFQAIVGVYERLTLTHDSYSTSASKRHQPWAQSHSSSQDHEEFDDEFDDDGISKDDSEDDSEDNSEDNFWYSWHYDFFGQKRGASDFDSFQSRYNTSAKERARKRAENVKKKYDWRDSVKPGAEKCSTCSIRDSITQSSAKSSGLNWRQYCAHPDRLRTCWACKNAHESVVTEAQAKRKWTVLGSTPSIFRRLEKERRFFSHQPITSATALTLSSKYYWVADLQPEALKRGWRPRVSRKRRSSTGSNPSGHKKMKKFAPSMMP